MPRNTPLNDTVTYTNSMTQITGRPMYEASDCVPVAIAISFNVSYETAREWCKKYMGRSTGRGTSRMAHDAFMSNKELLKELGYKVTDLQYEETGAALNYGPVDPTEWVMNHTRGRMTKKHPNERKTARMRYTQWWLENRRNTGRFPILRMAKGRIFGVVKHHAFSMVDGQVFDNSDRKSGRHNVERAYLVEKI
jgi:hypothetical protein